MMKRPVDLPIPGMLAEMATPEPSSRGGVIVQEAITFCMGIGLRG